MRKYPSVRTGILNLPPLLDLSFFVEYYHISPNYHIVFIKLSHNTTTIMKSKGESFLSISVGVLRDEKSEKADLRAKIESF